MAELVSEYPYIRKRKVIIYVFLPPIVSFSSRKETTVLVLKSDFPVSKILLSSEPKNICRNPRDFFMLQTRNIYLRDTLIPKSNLTNNSWIS